MSQVESVEIPSADAQIPAANDTSAAVMVAPTLRVEELKDDGHSSYSEEEGVSSHGEASDKDAESEKSKSPKGSTTGLETEFVPPDDMLKEKIIAQVEFYFSDTNILKDAFLLKHVRRNKQGYVSLKLITSFRKIKSLTKDYRAVAYSLRQSELLEVNEESTKVRRHQPLPDYDETTPSRTVVAVNLPSENPTIESVAELFKQCGDIALIRVLRPGKTIPPDVKKHLAKHPEFDNAVCAVVEFEQHESAKKAIAQMNNSDDWRKGLRVILLAQSKKENAAKANKKSENTSEELTDKTDEQFAEMNLTGENKKRKNKKKKGSRVDELAQSGGEGESPNGDADADTVGDKGESYNLASGEPIERRKSTGAGIPSGVLGRASLSPNPEMNRLSPSTTPRSSPRNTPRSSPRSSPRGSPNLRRKVHGKSPLVGGEHASPMGSPEAQRRNSTGMRKGSVEMSGSSPGGSPWVQRRLKAQQEQGGGAALAGRSPGTSPRLGRRFGGVLREPKGPDGTTGFYAGAGRGKPAVPAN